jgi:transcriptional regulator with XRE-family HTH domain
MAEDPNPPPAAAGARGRRRAGAVDLEVARRVRRRRVELGLTLQEAAELVGVPFQQLHKYETGANRISAGRLHRIAQTLDVEVGHFFADLDPGRRGRAEPAGIRAQRQMLVRLVRDVAGIGDPKVQEAVCELVRVLAALETNASASPDVDRPRRGTPCW